MPTAPFAIDIPQTTLDDLHARLQRTRWRQAIAADWTSGASSSYLRQLGEYWTTTFDWRAQERCINRWPQFRADVDGVGIHFIHVRGKGPRAPRTAVMPATRSTSSCRAFRASASRTGRRGTDSRFMSAACGTRS